MTKRSYTYLDRTNTIGNILGHICVFRTNFLLRVSSCLRIVLNWGEICWLQIFIFIISNFSFTNIFYNSHSFYKLTPVDTLFRILEMSNLKGTILFLQVRSLWSRGQKKGCGNPIKMCSGFPNRRSSRSQNSSAKSAFNSLTQRRDINTCVAFSMRGSSTNDVSQLWRNYILYFVLV